MKQIITILLFTILCINSNAQCDLPYKPLTEFGTDTVAFMTYNFTNRADYYKGKTLNKVIHDLQIPIKGFQTSPVKLKGQLPDTDNSQGIYIYIYPYPHIQRAMIRESILNSIYIEWENTIPENEYTKKVGEGWTQEIFDYLKDKKIESIRYTDRIRKPVRSRPL
ncbi:MAG: hypothetical protein ACK5M3_19470 [Dysgonomonas sp.]